MNCLNESLSYEQYTLSSFPILKSISKAITCLLYISHLFCSNYMSKSLSNRMHFSSIFPQHSMAMVLKQEITKSSVITNKYVDTWSVHICGHECGYSLCCCFLPLVAIVNRCGWDGGGKRIFALPGFLIITTIAAAVITRLTICQKLKLAKLLQTLFHLILATI